MASPTVTDPYGTRPRSRGWMIFWGVLLIIAGILAIVMPEVAALATVLTLGWLLLFAGCVEVIHAIQTRHAAGFGWRVAVGILTLVLGLILLFFPLAGAATLALWIGAFLLVGGIFRCVLAFRVRPRKCWVCVLFDGMVSLAVAVLLVFGWPASSIAFIGLLTGFWLLFAGIWRIMLDDHGVPVSSPGGAQPLRP
jgi:uncharacterized membrane protein HdeD (DUF308 family)